MVRNEKAEMRASRRFEEQNQKQIEKLYNEIQREFQNTCTTGKGVGFLSISVRPPLYKKLVELAWCSGSVMDYQATAWGSIPGGNGVKTELHVLRKRQ